MSTPERVRALVEPLVADLGLELYDLEVTGGVVRVTVDQPGGGVDMDAIASLTRSISRAARRARPDRRARTPSRCRAPGSSARCAPRPTSPARSDRRSAIKTVPARRRRPSRRRHPRARPTTPPSRSRSTSRPASAAPSRFDRDRAGPHRVRVGPGRPSRAKGPEAQPAKDPEADHDPEKKVDAP